MEGQGRGGLGEEQEAVENRGESIAWPHFLGCGYGEQLHL